MCGLLNRSRKGDWISPTEARQIEEREDQFSVWNEEHNSDYQPSEGSLPDEDTEDERDSLVEYGIGSSPDDAMEFSGDGMAGGHQDPAQGSKTQPGCSLDNPVDIAFR